MNQNLDKSKIRDLIQKARPQDLLFVTVNPIYKDSVYRFLLNGKMSVL
jgi:hypothetical protein